MMEKILSLSYITYKRGSEVNLPEECEIMTGVCCCRALIVQNCLSEVYMVNPSQRILVAL